MDSAVFSNIFLLWQASGGHLLNINLATCAKIPLSRDVNARANLPSVFPARTKDNFWPFPSKLNNDNNSSSSHHYLPHILHK